MSGYDTFRPDDLNRLDDFLCRGHVRPMEALPGNVFTIAMRHDCDNVIEPAVRLAEWEADRGYWSTYYILHTAPYWQDKWTLRSSLDRIAELGHEIGIHNDAITVQLETGRPAVSVLSEAVEELRGYGFQIRSTVAHGHRRCGVDRYVNDELFTECQREGYGNVPVEKHSLKAFGLEFDANWLPRGDYLSDTGGRWSQDFDTVTAAWPDRGQLHILQHPDWWGAALPARVAA